MGDYIILAVSCIFVNNILLMQYLGNCPFLGVSKRMETAIGMAMAVVFVLVMAGAMTWVTDNFILKPFGYEYLRTLAFILVIASLVQFVEMFLRKSVPALYAGLGIFLPLITTNCAVMGVCLININEEYTFIQALISSFSYAVGFGLALILFCCHKGKDNTRKGAQATSGHFNRTGVRRHAFPLPFSPLRGWSKQYCIKDIVPGPHTRTHENRRNNMLGGLLVMGGLGIVVGAGLAIASKIFYVYVDPKIEAIEDALPGANCGGCGLPGCSANAEAIVKGKASPSSCVAGGPELAAEIAEIMGVKFELREPEIAKPGCTYGVQDADLKFRYDGVQDCRAAVLLNGGSKLCPIGCLGLGTCVKACPFDALRIGPDNLPVVDMEKCTGCGTCERVCPKNIIHLTSNTLRIMHLNVLDECLAPCQQRCPAQVDIPLYIRLIDQGRDKEALQVIKESVPMPLSIGRVCPHFCESECRRNSVDEPVNINHLKRFCADKELKSGSRYETPKAPLSEKKVAIVGGGPAGLAAAYYLTRMGHASTIFEAMPKLGGIAPLRYP